MRLPHSDDLDTVDATRHGIDRDALILGYAGVYSSFLLFAQRAAAKYGVSSRDILVELGQRNTVGGQEDMIEDVALDMARAARSRE